MNIVIDSNILFSALIKDSLTRRLILDYGGLFLFPEFIFEEMEKHKKELLTKSKMDKQDFNRLLNIMLRKVIIVPNELIRAYKKEALHILRDIDVNDIAFIACALACRDSILWSDDKDLKRQTRIRIMNTKEAALIL